MDSFPANFSPRCFPFNDAKRRLLRERIFEQLVISSNHTVSLRSDMYQEGELDLFEKERVDMEAMKKELEALGWDVKITHIKTPGIRNFVSLMYHHLDVEIHAQSDGVSEEHQQDPIVMTP